MRTKGREHPGRTGAAARYCGFIHADAYAGYNPLYAGGATHVGCWAHARRSFFEAKDSDPARAHEALACIRLLYAKLRPKRKASQAPTWPTIAVSMRDRCAVLRRLVGARSAAGLAQK